MNIEEDYNNFLKQNPDYKEHPYFALLYVKMIFILRLFKSKYENSLIEETRTLFVDASFDEKGVEELKKTFSGQDITILNNMTYMRKIQIGETPSNYDMLFLDFDGTITKIADVSRFEPEYITFIKMSETLNNFETKFSAGKNEDSSKVVEEFNKVLGNTPDVFGIY